jgi:hypothetical protein
MKIESLTFNFLPAPDNKTTLVILREDGTYVGTVMTLGEMMNFSNAFHEELQRLEDRIHASQK